MIDTTTAITGSDERRCSLKNGKPKERGKLSPSKTVVTVPKIRHLFGSIAALGLFGTHINSFSLCGIFIVL